MSDVMETLSKPMGPLPLGGWLIAAAGGIGVAVVVRRYSADSEATGEGAADLSGYQTGGGSDLTINDGGGRLDNTTPGAGNLYTPPDPQYVDDVEAPTTNAEWRTRAISTLAQNGYNGAAADTAISAYIAGKTLNSAQQDMVAAAIRLVGGTPDPITAAPATPTPAKPAPKPTPAKPAPKPAPNPSRYKTNAAWRRAAIDWLVASKKASRALARSGIDTYLGLKGGRLGPNEARVVGQALGRLGPPPKIPKPVKVSSVPTASAAVTPTRRDNGSGF